MKRANLLLCFFLLLHAMLPAQTRQAEQLRDNVVAIHTIFENGYEEYGFGFVTGQRDGLLFIATAAHVVEQGAEQATIKLRFRGDYREYAGRLIRSNTEWDLALLECERPASYRWEEDYAGDAPQRNQQVSYIGRNGEWYVPTAAVTGVINRVRDSRILVDIIGLSRGTSGAPLINETGIVGLITEAETAQATAVALSKARQLLTNYGEYPFLFNRSEAAPVNPEPDETNPDPDMVWVEGGTYNRGCTPEQENCADDEKPVMEVRVDGFWMSKYEVTNAEFCDFLNSEGNQEEGGKTWLDIDDEHCNILRSGGTFRPKSGFADHPVIEVSWYGAAAYCQWKRAQTGRNYRLPTEAEWEYAARGGNQSRGYQYAGSDNLSEVAWYDDNSAGKTHPVGQKKPNELGIYDMSGNVYEWCQDVGHDSYEGAPTDGSAWLQGGNQARRVLRGGSWSDVTWSCRVAFRYWGYAANTDNYSGFRLAQD